MQETQFEIVDKKTGKTTPVTALAYDLNNVARVSTDTEVHEFSQDVDSGKLTHKKYTIRTKGSEQEGNTVVAKDEGEVVGA